MSRNQSEQPYRINFSAAEILAQRLNKAMPNWWELMRGALLLTRDNRYPRVPDDDGYPADYQPLIDVRDPVTCEGMRILVAKVWPGCRVQTNDTDPLEFFVKIYSPTARKFVYDGDIDRIAVAYIKAIEAGKRMHVTRTGVLRGA